MLARAMKAFCRTPFARGGALPTVEQFDDVERGFEPPLRELLEDPVTRAIMRSDNVKRHELDAIVAEARLAIAGR